MNNFIKCKYWDCGWCYYNGHFKANIYKNKNQCGCKGFNKCEVYKNYISTNNIKDYVNPLKENY